MSVGEIFLHRHADELKKLLAVLGVLLVLALCAYLFSRAPTATQQTTTSATASYPPPFTPAVQAQLAASKGFQLLVTYTNRGFEPAETTLKKGETVRFTNNSSENLWVASTGVGGRVYPADSQAECGQSALDSCRIIKHGEFWEFTFDVVGTWSYQNNVDVKMRGLIEVK